MTKHFTDADDYTPMRMADKDARIAELMANLKDGIVAMQATLAYLNDEARQPGKTWLRKTLRQAVEQSRAALAAVGEKK